MKTACFVCVCFHWGEIRDFCIYISKYTLKIEKILQKPPQVSLNSLASDSKNHFLFYRHSLPDLDVKVIFQEISNCVLCLSPNLHLAGQ